ncbi:MAG: LysM peptidoglycan-binding domain-containing protein [Microgenomates group bacterium]|jgi:LysM repeat protein
MALEELSHLFPKLPSKKQKIIGPTEQEIEEANSGQYKDGIITRFIKKHPYLSAIGATSAVAAVAYELVPAIHQEVDSHVQDLFQVINLETPAIAANSPRAEKLPAPEMLSPVEKTYAMLTDINQKIDSIYEMRESWKIGTPYHVQKGDTLTNIAEQNNTTVDKIMKLNKFSSTNLFEGQVFSIPINPDPAPHIVTVFNQAKADLTELEKIKKEKGENSTEAKTLAANIEAKWHTAPAKSEPVKTPEIIVDPSVKNSEFIVPRIEKFNSYLLKIGLTVDRILVLPCDPSFPYPMGARTFPDKGAEVLVYEYPDSKNKQDLWTERRFYTTLFHEYNHTMDPYEPYAARNFTPEQLVNTVFEDTQISNDSYKVYPETSRVMLHSEASAWEGVILLTTNPKAISTSPDREIEKRELDYANKRLSIILEPEIAFSKIGEELGVQPN